MFVFRVFYVLRVCVLSLSSFLCFWTLFVSVFAFLCVCGGVSRVGRLPCIVIFTQPLGQPFSEPLKLSLSEGLPAWTILLLSLAWTKVVMRLRNDPVI